MNRLRNDAILVSLIEKLREYGSWCGETHVQKATYFLQEMLSVPLDFDFILYKHGPFSFDLRHELAAMRADRFVVLQPTPPPYGPSIVPDKGARFLKTRFPKTIARHNAEIKFVARKFADRDVCQLERLATSLYVSVKLGPEAPLDARAVRVHTLKPHITVSKARESVSAVDGWRREYAE